MRRILAALVAAFAILIPAAQAEWTGAPLDAVASHFAMRDVRVLCRNEDEDTYLVWAWGYVNWPIAEQTDTKIHEKLCLGALAIDLDVPEVPDWQKALGVMVIVHESFHLKHVRNALSEKITECRAFRKYDEAFRLLGAEPAVMARLMPLAIARHFWFLREIPKYDLKSCETPKRYRLWLGE